MDRPVRQEGLPKLRYVPEQKANTANLSIRIYDFDAMSSASFNSDKADYYGSSSAATFTSLFAANEKLVELETVR